MVKSIVRPPIAYRPNLLNSGLGETLYDSAYFSTEMTWGVGSSLHIIFNPFIRPRPTRIKGRLHKVFF